MLPSFGFYPYWVAIQVWVLSSFGSSRNFGAPFRVVTVLIWFLQVDDGVEDDAVGEQSAQRGEVPRVRAADALEVRIERLLYVHDARNATPPIEAELLAQPQPWAQEGGWAEVRAGRTVGAVRIGAIRALGLAQSRGAAILGSKAAILGSAAGSKRTGVSKDLQRPGRCLNARSGAPVYR